MIRDWFRPKPTYQVVVAYREFKQGEAVVTRAALTASIRSVDVVAREALRDGGIYFRTESLLMFLPLSQILMIYDRLYPNIDTPFQGD